MPPVTPKLYPLQEALKAQTCLRDAAGLGPEMFPVGAFVGMISDEIEALRKTGRTDDQIAELIGQSSAIQITGQEIADHYAAPEQRHAGQ